MRAEGASPSARIIAGSIGVAVVICLVLPPGIQASPGGKSAAQPSGPAQNQKLMQELMDQPHHLLAAAYRDNLERFARALIEVAKRGDTVPADFARASVAEMNRSLDLLQAEHGKLLESLTEDSRASLGRMPDAIGEQLALVKREITSLKKVTQNEPVESQTVLNILSPMFQEKGTSGVATGGGGEWLDETEGEDEEQRVRDQELMTLTDRLRKAQGEEKVALLTEIVTRLVQERGELRMRMGDLHSKMRGHMIQHMPDKGACREGEDCGEDNGGGED